MFWFTYFKRTTLDNYGKEKLTGYYIFCTCEKSGFKDFEIITGVDTIDDLLDEYPLIHPGKFLYVLSDIGYQKVAEKIFEVGYYYANGEKIDVDEEAKIYYVRRFGNIFGKEYEKYENDDFEFDEGKIEYKELKIIMEIDMLGTTKCTHCKEKPDKKMVVFDKRPIFLLTDKSYLCEECYEIMRSIMEEKPADSEDSLDMFKDMGINPIKLLNKKHKKEDNPTKL
jgi:hypothetical protein